MNKPKIGIFAGTFDPIHDGHLAFARAGIATGLEKVMFLPEPRPRRKQGVKALEHRIKMVQLAIKDEPNFSTIILKQARFSPHETLPLLQARFPGYQMVLFFGDDVISHMANWPHIDALINSVELLIASRYQNTDSLRATINTLQQTRNLKFKYKIVHPGHEQIASSAIRLDAKHGKPLMGVPLKVQKYISEHGLYSSADESK